MINGKLKVQVTDKGEFNIYKSNGKEVLSILHITEDELNSLVKLLLAAQLNLWKMKSGEKKR